MAVRWDVQIKGIAWYVVRRVFVILRKPMLPNSSSFWCNKYLMQMGLLRS